MTYEQALHELQAITARLQEATVGIDALAEQVRRANALIRYCRERLRMTEQEIRQLSDAVDAEGEEGFTPQ